MDTSAVNPAIRTYPAPFGTRLAHDFIVRVRPVGTGDEAWFTLDTHRVKVDMHDVTEASMAFFDADFEACGPLEVEVCQRGWSRYCHAAIRPLSLGVEPTVEQRSVRFTVDRPMNLSVEINRDRRHNLHLFVGDLRRVEAMEADPDVTIAGNPNGENTLNLDVPEVRDALASMAARPAGERRPVKVLVKRAHYCVANCMADVPSGLDLVLEGGAVLDGGLRVRHAQGVSVRGHGVLDLADYKRFSGMSGVLVEFNRDVTIDGLMFVNPPHYTVMLGASQNVTVRDIKAFSCEGWSDGIDMMACRGATIEGCFMRNSDDCIAVYGSRWDYRGGTSDVSVRDCTLWADVAHPMMIGTHGDHEHDGDVLERLSFEDIDVLEHNEYQDGYLGVMAINAGDANTVRDVTWRCIRIERFQRGRVFDIETKWNKDYNPRPGRLVENVLIEDVDVAGGVDELPSLIRGVDEAHPVRNVTIRNLRREGRPCATPVEANLQTGPHAANITLLP